MAEAAILKARSENRWVDASIELERWVAACRRQTPAIVAPGVLGAHGGSGSALASAVKATTFLARGRALARQQSQEDEDDPAIEQLRERWGFPVAAAAPHVGS